MKRPSADISKPNNDSDDKDGTGKRARIVAIAPDSTFALPQQQDNPTPTVNLDPLHRTTNECQTIDIALVDFFAGFRTVHVAAKSTRVNFVLCASAEKCPFANRLTKKNKIIEKLFEDVKHMDKTWAKAFVSDAITLGAKCNH